MKTIKYILLAIILISLSIRSFSQEQAGELLFLEAYTLGELSAKLAPDDPFFGLIQTEDRSTESAKLGCCPESEVSQTWAYLNSPEFKKELPVDLRFAWGAEEVEKGKYLYALKESGTGYTGPGKGDIKEIEIKDGLLFISFSKDGARKWTELTRKSVGHPMAIVINDLVYSAPMVREVITGGKCAISGTFSSGELAELKLALEH
jgi:SecD/SecF fusion protein